MRINGDDAGGRGLRAFGTEVDLATGPPTPLGSAE